MCGRRRLGKNFLSYCSIGRVRSCVRGRLEKRTLKRSEQRASGRLAKTATIDLLGVWGRRCGGAISLLVALVVGWVFNAPTNTTRISSSLVFRANVITALMVGTSSCPPRPSRRPKTDGRQNAAPENPRSSALSGRDAGRVDRRRKSRLLGFGIASISG
jgi:hypothetical protein